MPITESVIVWAEPTERTHLHLLSGDIKRACEWFEDITGQEPKMIVLNPKNEHLAEEADEGKKVNYSEGCLFWEIWLAIDDNFIASSQRTESEGKGPKAQDHSRIPYTKMLPINEDLAIVNNLGARGRSKTYKKRELPEGLIKQLNREGLGLKAIASRLKREKGIKVSHMTIQRVLSGERKGSIEIEPC